MVFLDLWEKELIRVGKSTNSVSSYIRDVKKFIMWFEESYGEDFQGRILNIDLKAYQLYLLNIRKQNINTILRNTVALKQFNNFLGVNGINDVSRDILTSTIKKADSFDRNIKVLNPKDSNRLRRAFYSSANLRDIAIYETLSNTGIRVSELIGLELDDINLTDRNGENNYSYIRIRSGKGDVYREVPLNSTCKTAIKDYLNIRPSSTSIKVFIGERGPLQRYAINKLLTKYCDLAKIETIGPHVLRHNFATKLLTVSKADLVTISRLLGHSSSKVTENFYINISTEEKLKAVKSLDL